MIFWIFLHIPLNKIKSSLKLSLQATCWHCSSSVISQQPSVRWMSAAGILCTGRRSNLWSWSWRRCCTVGKRSKLLLHMTAEVKRTNCFLWIVYSE